MLLNQMIPAKLLSSLLFKVKASIQAPAKSKKKFLIKSQNMKPKI